VGIREELDGNGVPKRRLVVFWGAVRGVAGRPAATGHLSLINFFAPWRDKPVEGYGSTTGNLFQKCVGPRYMQVVARFWMLMAFSMVACFYRKDAKAQRRKVFLRGITGSWMVWASQKEGYWLSGVL